MSWSTLPPELRAIAESALTEKELEALRLWDGGMGYGQLGLALGIAKETARDRVKRAMRKLQRAAAREGLIA